MFMYATIDSDIIGLNVLGSNIVVLDTLEAANDLLDKRSTLYSGRSVLHCTRFLSVGQFLTRVLMLGHV